MTNIITFYNHKGGVSKTTTIFNLAHYLSENNKKVLVVDADPQCNATEILLSRQIAMLDEEQYETGIDKEISGESLLEILKPRIEGEIPAINTQEIRVNRINDNIHLIRGDVSLSSIEDALAEAHIQRFSTKTHDKRTYVALGDFLTRFGEEQGYHFILIDVGPSSGALTRSCFLACDGFFIPTAPDRFNVQAIATLSSIIDRWMSEHQQIYNQFLELGLPIKHGKPKFLGTTIQQFKTLNGRPKPGYRLWMDRIPNNVLIKLFPVLRKHSTDKDLTCGLDENTITATDIPDFGTLAPLMQEYGKAVFQITQPETAIVTETGTPWGGGTWLDAQRRMNTYKTKYKTIADRLDLLL
ncbi:Chromosome-partitioning ATPase Soj [Paenibacillus konkukensis]|uniref:Chromosome-partitioning ATPase Soj n=1 Tax=Paenibacillus konkukensis TaxID=2020716 RepID=A0ABY4RP63_9BACL|nr:ParA family protein [Paenibacillus konkukensis]UQZ84264.1 Chromosome-partitioning ATPase Soj [Paenibacillus konkukensis]